MKIHPAADIFPMMSEEELADLAEDIKANGLLHPIVLDADKQLIDGRNRYAACKLAGVQPQFEQLNGRDPLALIISANLNRRNLTKGQRAMALAKLYPDVEKGGRGKKSAAINSAETAGFSGRRVNEARVVLAHSAALADEVLKGVTSLDAALKQANEEKHRVEGDKARLDRLSRLAPDLYELVTEGRMTLGEATKLLIERDDKRRQNYEAGVSASKRVTDLIGHVHTILMGENARGEKDPPIPLTAEQVELVAASVRLLEEFYRRREAGEWTGSF